MGKKIFISYKRQDLARVKPIVESIRRRTGVDCWIDMGGIESGDQFDHVIIEAINACEVVIFMMSRASIAPFVDPRTGLPNSKITTWTEREVKFALNKQKRVIPVSIDGTMVNDCDWLSLNFSNVDSIDYSDKEQREKFFRNLTALLNKDEGGETTQVEQSAPPTQLAVVPKRAVPLKAIGVVAFVLLAIGCVVAWLKQSGSQDAEQPRQVAVSEVPDSSAVSRQDTTITLANQQPASQPIASEAPVKSPSNEKSSSRRTETRTTQPALPAGKPSALDSIGSCYLFGKGKKKDAQQAVLYYRSAAEKGYAPAQAHLGSCYYNGVGIGRDYKQAFTWFSKAANAGDVTAQDNLGSCYLLGHGTAQSYPMAVKWYRMAANAGDANAQTHLGSCYYYGQGVGKDLQQAAYWYGKAAEQGNETAKKNLSKISQQ